MIYKAYSYIKEWRDFATATPPCTFCGGDVKWAPGTFCGGDIA